MDIRILATDGSDRESVDGPPRHVRARRPGADRVRRGRMMVWGFRVHPPTLDRAAAAWLLNAGLMGAAEKRLFERSVERGHRVLDVGANQGLFTLLFSRLVGDEGHVFALEPDARL